ncbi:MAG: hypothetical protein ABSE25_09425 [Syntrophorhabdales bacterium]
MDRIPVGHGPYENALFFSAFHTDPVGEEGPLSGNAGRVDSDDADLFPPVAEGSRKASRDRALARAGRAGDAYYLGLARKGEEARKLPVPLLLPVFDQGNEAGCALLIALQDLPRELAAGQRTNLSFGFR